VGRVACGAPPGSPGPERRRALRLTIRAVAILAAGTTGACCSCGGCPPHVPPAAVTTVVTGPADLTVVFGGISSSDRPLLLYSGQRDGVCRAFEAYIGTSAGSVLIPQASWNPGCRTEVDIFAPYFGAWVRVVSESDLASMQWFHDALTAGTVTVPLPGLRTVNVASWVVAAGTDLPTARSVRDAQFSEADPIMASLGAGMTIVRSDGTLSPNGFQPDCDQAGALASMGAGYNPDAINVYFVKNYLNFPFGAYGMDCWIEGHPEVVFISWGNANTPAVALAHELGHALGLVIPHDPTIGGHTNSIYGDDGSNLMVSGAAAVTDITVGQSYGMNFDSFTWLNRAGATPQPLNRVCQDTFTFVFGDPCPAVTMVVSGWPVP